MKKLSELTLSDLVALEGIILRKQKSILSYIYLNGEQKVDLAKTRSVLVLIRKEIQTRINELELCLNIY